MLLFSPPTLLQQPPNIELLIFLSHIISVIVCTETFHGHIWIFIAGEVIHIQQILLHYTMNTALVYLYLLIDPND